MITTNYNFTEQRQRQNAAEIHDSSRCQCEMCLWADKQERQQLNRTEIVVAPFPDFDSDWRLAPQSMRSIATGDQIRAALFDVVDGGDWGSLWSWSEDVANETRTQFVDAVITRIAQLQSPPHNMVNHRHVAHLWHIRGGTTKKEELLALENEDLKEAARLRGLVREVIR